MHFTDNQRKIRMLSTAVQTKHSHIPPFAYFKQHNIKIQSKTHKNIFALLTAKNSMIYIRKYFKILFQCSVYMVIKPVADIK